MQNLFINIYNFLYKTYDYFLMYVSELFFCSIFFSLIVLSFLVSIVFVQVIFKKYMPKGGDIMLIDNKNIHVIELKNRTTEFPDNEIVAEKKIKKYAKDLIKEYPENMLIAVEYDKEAISTDLLNYTNAYKDREFCYARSDLKKPEVIAELKSLPLKSRFQQLLIINSSDYHDPATPSDYAFEQSELSQYTDDQKIKFIAMNELAVLECFENPSFKVNADLSETKIIYNNTFYARSSN